jgi:hypothetical protein
MSNMQDWNAYRDALIGRGGKFAKLSPQVTRGLIAVHAKKAASLITIGKRLT